MRQRSTIYSSIIGLVVMVLFIPGYLFAQEGEYTVSIKQPAKDTTYTCPGTNVIFIGEGHNSDGSAFDDNQVIYTWEFGEGGEIVEGPTVAYEFTEGGHYRVKLSVISLNNNPAQNLPEIHVFVGMPPFFTGPQ